MISNQFLDSFFGKNPVVSFNEIKITRDHIWILQLAFYIFLDSPIAFEMVHKDTTREDVSNFYERSIKKHRPQEINDAEIDLVLALMKYIGEKSMFEQARLIVDPVLKKLLNLTNNRVSEIKQCILSQVEESIEGVPIEVLEYNVSESSPKEDIYHEFLFAVLFWSYFDVLHSQSSHLLNSIDQDNNAQSSFLLIAAMIWSYGYCATDSYSLVRVSRNFTENNSSFRGTGESNNPLIIKFLPPEIMQEVKATITKTIISVVKDFYRAS